MAREKFCILVVYNISKAQKNPINFEGGDNFLRKPPKIQVFWAWLRPIRAQHAHFQENTTRSHYTRHIQVSLESDQRQGSYAHYKQTNRQTDKQTDRHYENKGHSEAWRPVNQKFMFLRRVKQQML